MAQIAVGQAGIPLPCGVVVPLFKIGPVWCARIIEVSHFSGSLLFWVLKGQSKYVQPVHMRIVVRGKAFDRVPQDILWGSSRSI